MRVLFLTHRLPYAPNRGDRIRSYHIARQLSRSSDVDVLSLTHDDEEESHVADLRRMVDHVRTARVSRIANLCRAVAALPTSRPLTHVLLDAPTLGTTLAEMVAERRPDVVLAYCSGVARLVMEAPLRGIPAVVDFVDVDSEKWRDLARVTPPPKAWIYRRECRLLGRFESAVAYHAKAALVVNEREQASLENLAPRARVHVLPNGIDLSMFQPAIHPSSNASVIFCGVMNYAPNEQAALWIAKAVWPLVRAERPDATLLLVGADPTSAVRALAVRDRSVTVTGTVPDVRPFLHSAALATAPLATARGIQNKVLEAIASGLPSVVTPAVFEGLPAEAAPACRVAGSSEAFAASILDLLRRAPAERRAIAARANLAPLGWNERLAPLLDIVREAAGFRVVYPGLVSSL
ncbi:MAG TPA: TIGR03087 family PEP-CTERM/XrtA system glycosyltransferase [Vicinamibacterales bacterium]|jgi:sugar transferase (PEP-CTERM/EpsH1 system associated)|nr:TIGR03087 family PEP-CTERM/XrtA system glycosyltransferase [Vicinamibacterales bacterium]